MSESDMNQPSIASLTKAQVNLLDQCEKLGWGKMEVTVKNGQPVMITILRQDIKLD